MIFGTSVVQ